MLAPRLITTPSDEGTKRAAVHGPRLRAPAREFVRSERERRSQPSPAHKGPEGTAMVQVREKSRFGPCYALGELIGETATRYLYRNRAGTAFVSKSSSIHLAPCQVCADYQQSDEAA